MERTPARSAAVGESEAENEKKKTSVAMVVGVEDGEAVRGDCGECRVCRWAENGEGVRKLRDAVSNNLLAVFGARRGVRGDIAHSRRRCRKCGAVLFPIGGTRAETARHCRRARAQT